MNDSKPIIVAIDGPAGVGKSTLARKVAATLNIAYLDTGAMFRTVALHLAEKYGVTETTPFPESSGDLPEHLAQCSFALEGSGAETRLLCNGRVVGEEIRSEEAGLLASKIATLSPVRDFLKNAQKHLGRSFSLVAEGRDIGTVVFPNALCKIFLDASPEVRAKRRFLQLRELDQPCELDVLAGQIRARDEQDKQRSIAPLRAADDATIIDTSNLDIDQVFEAIMLAVKTRKEHLPPERSMRRKNREIPYDDAVALLHRAEYGILAMQTGTGANAWPYAVPLSFILMDGALYFHCALEGLKVEALAHESKVCFTVVGNTQPVYDGSFSTYYESVIVFGRACLVEDKDVKRRALFLLAEKYLPDNMDRADKDINASFSRTAVYRITMDSVSGKAKRKKP